MSNSIFNNQLLKTARYALQQKRAFVDPATAGAGSGDPAAAPGGGGAPPGGAPAPGGDPMAAMMGGMGGAPPGGDPAAAAGASPTPGPSSAGGVGREEIQSMIQQAMQMNAGGAGGAPGEPPKKKVDVNTEMYQIKKMLAMLMGKMGLEVPATMTLGDPADDPHVPPGEAAKDPHSAASMQSAIGTIDPMQGASPGMVQQQQQQQAQKSARAGYEGQAYDASTLIRDTTTKAAALAALLRGKQREAGRAA